MPYRILVSDNKDPDLGIERDVFAGMDVDLERRPCHTASELRDAAADAHAIISDASTPLTADVIGSLPDLEIISRAGIGFDNVDVEAAREHGVTVTNVPDYSVDEVSTHAMALLLSLARRLPTYRDDTRAHNWDWQAGTPMHRLRRQTLGVVALGKIGRRTVEKARPYFEEVVGYDPHVDRAVFDDLGVTPVSFEELLARADAISIHAPLTEETRGLFDADAFDRMQAGTILVNTGRGGIVDRDALEAALDRDTVAAAGLDVLETEPPEDWSLVDRDDVIVTPHVGWCSREASDEVRRRAAEQVRAVLSGGTPENPVEPEQWTE